MNAWSQRAKDIDGLTPLVIIIFLILSAVWIPYRYGFISENKDVQ